MAALRLLSAATCSTENKAVAALHQWAAHRLLPPKEPSALPVQLPLLLSHQQAKHAFYSQMQAAHQQCHCLRLAISIG